MDRSQFLLHPSLFPQRGNHGIERVRKLSQKIDVLVEIPLGYLLGLPSQMVQVGMQLFEGRNQEIARRWINVQDSF